MHRVLFAIHRKPELTFEEFLTHYRDVHIPMARELPKLRQYDIFPVQPGPDADGDTPDAFTSMTFDSVEDFEVFLGRPGDGRHRRGQRQVHRALRDCTPSTTSRSSPTDVDVDGAAFSGPGRTVIRRPTREGRGGRA